MGRNDGLVVTFLAKIAFTIIWIVASWLPTSWLSLFGLPTPEPIMFLRLLGMAYCALLVGYVVGCVQALRGQHPTTTIGVGIVSNGGAAGWLLYFWLAGGSWGSWGGLARLFMLGSLVAVSAITVGLIVFGGRGRGDPDGDQ